MTKNGEVFGKLRERQAERCEFLRLAFSPLNVPLRSRWRNSGLSADFMGDFVMTFLPTEVDLPVDMAKQSEIKHAVTYIANELLENAMKYHERDEDIPIGIDMELTTDSITVSASNGISGDQVKRYKSFIQWLLKEDPRDLLVQQLEESATREDAASSCLGLLTMMTDYGAELSWRFENGPSRPETFTVTTTAILPLTMEAK